MTEPRALDAALRSTRDPAWVLCAEGYDALRETSVESRFAISNGFLGVRGARAITRGAVGVVEARTYVAGLFGTPNTALIRPGLVCAPDWLQVRVSLPDGPLVRHPAEAVSHRRVLDFKRGALFSHSILRSTGPEDHALAVQARTLRLVSQETRALGLQLIQLEFQEGDVEVTLEASFEGTDIGLVVERLEQDLGLWRVPGSTRRLAMATHAALRVDGDELPPTAAGDLTRTWNWTSRPGQIVSFERLVAIVRSETEAHDPAPDAREKLGKATRLGWRGVLAGHEAAWSRRWKTSDVEVEGDAAAQNALRFAIYHLNSAANPADARVSIAARALTGDAYRGHVFWDTEVYLLPFYTMAWPEAARSLLMYRFRTLDGARAKAARMGWRGALYAWESADTGEETTPKEAIGPDRKIIPILSGLQEQHISADIAYAVWHYWQATGDEAFLLEAGAEILIETARFWASRAALESDGLRHIRGVIGPDEYHEHIDDNAFTNVMACWNLRRAIDVTALLETRWPTRWESLSGQLELVAEEIADWSDAAARLATGLDPTTGLYEQFAGFEQLEHVDLSAYSGRSVPMDVVLGRDRIQRAQVVKQADVVALLGLLPEVFVGDSAATNFHYYEPRCSHGSSLSRAMHGLVAARLGLGDLALDFFRQTAAIDLGDTHVAIDGGIHIAALGGVWLIAVFGFAGLSLTDSGLALDPRLPTQWRSLRFAVQWRGRSVSLRIGPAKGAVEATLISGDSMTLTVAGEPHDLAAGKAIHIGLRRPGVARIAQTVGAL